MTDALFSIVSLVAMLAWLLLALAAPLPMGAVRRALLFAAGRGVPVVLCAFYMLLLQRYWGATPGGGFQSLGAVQVLFSAPGKMLGAWTHFLAGIYGEIIDRSLLLTGTLLHDFAKEKEFTFSGLGLVTDYSLPGQLIGHLVMGAQEVQQCAQELGISEEKSLLLQHMILSHHGEPEFGAAVRPMCAEAELLSEIDLIDSRMEIYAEALQDLPVGSFSNRIFALDKKIYRHG